MSNARNPDVVDNGEGLAADVDATMLAGSDSAPLKVARLMADFPHPWAICGGWAIDLFLGRVNRPHKDVDIAVLRRDQLSVRSYLASRGWTLEKAVSGRLIPWAEDEVIHLPVHVVWCKNPSHDPDFVEILFNEADSTRFLFRRDPSITLDLDRAFLRTESGLPILAPETALLYKAGGAENDADFRTALPHLDQTRRDWLRTALETVHPGHVWLGAI